MRASTIYLFCLFIGCALAALNSNWRLAWSDEFDTLDKTKWNIRDKAGNYGNGEKQWYHPNQTTVSNGKLVLTAIKKTWGGQTYLSGLVDSMDKAFFTYGRYEVRVKMAAGKGLWPAMWLLSNTKCWGAGGEVDIAEFRGSYKTTIGNFYHYSSQCCAGFSNCISSKGSGKDLSGIITSPDLTTGYHTYALEWFAENMTWYVDDVKINSYKTKDLVVSPQDASPHYWILNSAVGGSYPGNPDSTTPFPNYVYIDYVRNYVWRTTCTGETCSNHGCCNSAKLCVCDDGWAGAKCEQWTGSITNKYDSIIHNLDNVPNGWGNDYTMYLTKNTVISSGALKFTLTNSGCPTSCGNKAWSSGAWEFTPRYTYGTYTFKAKGPYVNGTGLSMGAAGENYNSLEQVAFSILGNAPNIVEFRTWKTGFMWIHMRLDMGVDLSQAWHTYSFEYAPTYVVWYVDGVKRYNSTEVTPSGKLAMGVYYTAQPDWYGPFTYTEPSYVYLDETSWTQTLSKKGQC